MRNLVLVVIVASLSYVTTRYLIEPAPAGPDRVRPAVSDGGVPLGDQGGLPGQPTTLLQTSPLEEDTFVMPTAEQLAHRRSQHFVKRFRKQLSVGYLRFVQAELDMLDLPENLDLETQQRLREVLASAEKRVLPLGRRMQDHLKKEADRLEAEGRYSSYDVVALGDDLDGTLEREGVAKEKNHNPRIADSSPSYRYVTQLDKPGQTELRVVTVPLNGGADPEFTRGFQEMQMEWAELASEVIAEINAVARG